MSLYEVGEQAVALGAEKIVIGDRWKGGYGKIRFLKIGEGLTQVPPYIYIHRIKFQREFAAPRKGYHPLFIDEAEREGSETKNLAQMLSSFLGLTIMDPNKASPENWTIIRLSVDPSRKLQISFYMLPENIEAGPRITVSHVAWEI